MSMEQQERYALYHANDLLAMIAPQPEHWHTDPSRHYTHVADVEAPLGQVFTLTNHIDHTWTDNPEVVWHIDAPVRSTSVGDVIVSLENGQAWLVMPFGLQNSQRSTTHRQRKAERRTRAAANEEKEGRS